MAVREGEARPHALTWWRIFATGFVLWICSVIVTGLTGNLNMIPTVVLLGSFLVPASGVVWYLDHYHSPEVTAAVVARAFIVGGVLGTLAASLLESLLASDGILTYLSVGFVEEFAKLVALVFVARGLARYTIRDGIVLGAAVGFGFAALESSGYALTSLVVIEGHHLSLSLVNLVFTELVRGVLAPVGHGLWTAILGGVLFGAVRAGRFHITSGVVRTYVLVSMLHALWDSMRGIALVLTAILTATPAQRIAVTMGQIPPPTPAQVRIFVELNVGGLLAISIVGFVILHRLWQTPDVLPMPS